MTAGRALLPLRLFLGITFAYAGLQKLSDPGFLHEGAPTYIGTQLKGFADGAPGGWLLETFALPYPKVAGVAVALAEIAIGLLVTLGRYVRPAAAAGLALNLVLFLTATWHTSPYFLGADIAFVFAWLPFVLLGAEGQPRVERVPLAGTPMSRRALLGLAGAATLGLAGVATAARGRYRPPPPPPPSGTPLAAAADVAPGEGLAVAAPEGPVMLVRASDGALSAYSGTCTHAGCDVEWRGGRIACPCHGAQFDPATGAPTHGPAREPLPTLEVRERGTDIFLVGG